MFNDVIGGVPVTLAYCTLCGSGILFDARVAGYEQPFVFGSSGFLYRSNKLMCDQRSNSLWNQFTGKPVVGTLVGNGIELNIMPVVTTTGANGARNIQTRRYWRRTQASLGITHRTAPMAITFLASI
jgi:hypothetical protein